MQQGKGQKMENDPAMDTGLTRADRRWLRHYRKRLEGDFKGQTEQVLFYGSKARGDSVPDSDLDVLLIVRDSAAHLVRRMRDVGYLLAAEGDVVPSILAYTQSEWEARRVSGSPFREAVERDKVQIL